MANEAHQKSDTTFILRLPNALLAKLKRYAAMKDMSASKLVRILIRREVGVTPGKEKRT